MMIDAATEVRKLCLDLANRKAESSGDVVRLAKEYLDFVTGSAPTSGDTVGNAEWQVPSLQIINK